MTLPLGTRLGPYEIFSPLGAGGMGEVYRARDTKLNRDVAIKVLPALFASDAERLARFTREAQTLALLNHPNIAHIHGLEESNGVRALVMELVKGEDLSQRIARGPIPIDEALPIAKQIADAVEAAHEQGIIHRDLKPANIKITPDDRVKVLDFGLAKALESSIGAPGVSPAMTALPTMTALASRPGVIVGTAAYMSPEQAKGKPVDKRSDIWAFGCVLYEMVTGRSTFEGETMTDVIAAVVTKEPDWTALPRTTPPQIVELLHRCLKKDPRERLRDIGDARLGIDEALGGETPDVAVAAKVAPRRRVWLPWTVAALASIGVSMGVWYARPVALGDEIYVDINTPPTPDAVSLAISPDAKAVGFVALSNGQPVLWVRSLGSPVARPLMGTERASYPFWSYDGKSIAFFADGRLKTIDLESGSIRSLSNVVFPSGGTWNRDGVVLFVPGAGRPLTRISEAGGEPVPVVPIEAPRQFNLRAPHFLPDGHHFLYYVTGTPEARGVYAGDLGGGATKRLLDSDSMAVYSASGNLLFVRQGKLYAQAFDPVRLTLAGSAWLVADGIGVDAANVAPIATSSVGPIAYRGGVPAAQRQLVWFDRAGREIGRLGEADSASPFSPTLSPDMRHVVLYRTVGGNADIWTFETTRGVLSRFTFDTANELNPIWSADGKRIVFGMNRTGVFDIFQKPAGGPGGEQLLLETKTNKAPSDLSRDGRFMLYRSFDPKNGYDIWALPAGGQPFAVAQSPFDEREAQFSPDGRWIAYQSNESGRFEIFLQSFPDPKTRVSVSTDGGAQVRWRRDGAECFYIALDGRLMAVPVLGRSDGVPEIGAPVPLFLTHVGGAVAGPQKQQYDVAPDGQRFLMNTVIEEAASPISVIVNWKGRP